MYAFSIYADFILDFQFCVPSAGISLANATVTGALQSTPLSSVASSAAMSMADLLNAWGVILAGACIALVLAFVYLKLVEYCAGVLVWCMIFLFF